MREALVNALVHADLQGNTVIRIIKHRGGFEFVNPGLLLITPQQLWLGGQSVPRNQTLLHLFTLLRLGEKEGSGGPTLRQVWREQHWRAPRIWEDVEHSTTHARIRELSDAHPRDITSKLAELGRLRLLVSEGKTRATVYRPCSSSSLPDSSATTSWANTTTPSPPMEKSAIPELVAAGKLVALHGGTRHHPGQAYRTREVDEP